MLKRTQATLTHSSQLVRACPFGFRSFSVFFALFLFCLLRSVSVFLFFLSLFLVPYELDKGCLTIAHLRLVVGHWSMVEGGASDRVSPHWLSVCFIFA
jgi:hypothetical protein